VLAEMQISLSELLSTACEASHEKAVEVGMLLLVSCWFSQRTGTKGVGGNFKAHLLSLGNIQ